jgi:hypothetical protein
MRLLSFPAATAWVQSKAGRVSFLLLEWSEVGVCHVPCMPKSQGVHSLHPVLRFTKLKLCSVQFSCSCFALLRVDKGTYHASAVQQAAWPNDWQLSCWLWQLCAHVATVLSAAGATTWLTDGLLVSVVASVLNAQCQAPVTRGEKVALAFSCIGRRHQSVHSALFLRNLRWVSFYLLCFFFAPYLQPSLEQPAVALLHIHIQIVLCHTCPCRCTAHPHVRVRVGLKVWQSLGV